MEKIMDGLDSFLQSVAYKFPKGYPDIDDPKDKKMLFEMVSNLTEDTPPPEKITKELLLKLLKGVDVDNMSDNALKVLYDRISNFSSYKPILKALGGKKFKANTLKRYAKEIQDVIERLGPEQQQKFIKYLDNPKEQIDFPTDNTGNLYTSVPTDKIPKSLVTNILRHSSTDDKGRGVGMGELGMALIFKNVEAPVPTPEKDEEGNPTGKMKAAKGDLSLNGKEFEIKGNGASLGSTPDVIFKRTKALRYWEPLEAFGLHFGNNKQGKIGKYVIKDKDGKEIKKISTLNMFPEAIAFTYQNTTDKEGFKEAFKEFLIKGGELSSPDFNTVFDSINLSNSDSIHKTIAYLNVVRYIALEGFEYFMAHDIGAGGGDGTYIYAGGSPTDIVKGLKKGNAKFEKVAYNNLRPRIGFKSDYLEETISEGINEFVMVTFH
tara:strand:+ start:89 stop:1390 length:1302 start_codon:yes stop_codon:yes gene_type:complete